MKFTHRKMAKRNIFSTGTLWHFVMYAWVCAGTVFCDDDENHVHDSKHTAMMKMAALDTLGDSYDTILRFTYGDDDDTGPKHWGKNNDLQDFDGDSIHVPQIKERIRERNYCAARWYSPINILTRSATAPELVRKELETEVTGKVSTTPRTLTVVLTSPHIEYLTWELGHPVDTYHGIEVRSTNMGIFHIMEKADPLPGTDEFTTYDFKFMSIFYCDLAKSPNIRTMHQIDGQRFPLELEFVFFQKPFKDIGVDQNIISDDSEGESNIGIIVTVQGELGKQDNKYLQPLIEAATAFRGKSFGNYDVDDANIVEIKTPWSPTWLLPDASSYYYYNDGSFPVPPCWKVARYYIMKDKIKISQSQLDVLTNLKTRREKGNTLSCAFSILQHEIAASDVTQNLMEYEFVGTDHKSRTPEEIEARQDRRKGMEIFRKRLAGQAVFTSGSVVTIGQTSKVLLTFIIVIHVKIVCFIFQKECLIFPV